MIRQHKCERFHIHRDTGITVLHNQQRWTTNRTLNFWVGVQNATGRLQWHILTMLSQALRIILAWTPAYVYRIAQNENEIKRIIWWCWSYEMRQTCQAIENAVLVPFFKWCNRSLRASGTPQIVMQVGKTNLRHINVVYAVTSCFINTYKVCCVYSAVCWYTSKRVYRLNSKCCIIECAMYMCAQTLQSVYCVCTTTV